MPIPLLVPVIGALVAAAATEEEPSERPEWQIRIGPDEWKSEKGHIRVSFEDRIVIGDTGPVPDRLSSKWVVFAKFSAPFDGEEVRDWFDAHLDQLEETREYVLVGGAKEAAGVVSDFNDWLQHEASLLPGEWTFSILDDVFDDVSESGNHGFIDVNYRDREVNAYSLVSGVSEPRLGNGEVRIIRHIFRPISGEEIREWFESRESDLERERRKELVFPGFSSFQVQFSVDNFKPVFFSPLDWLKCIAQNGTYGVIRDLLSLDLKDMIDLDLSWTITRFEPADLAEPAASFLSDELRYDLRKLADRIDFVEGDEVLKILDEPYLFLQIRPPEPDEDGDSEEEYEQDVRQIAEEMEKYTKKRFISIQRDDDGRQLPYVQISLPWKL